MAGDLFRIELSYILMMLIKQGITTTISPLPLLPRILPRPPPPPPPPTLWIPPTPPPPPWIPRPPLPPPRILPPPPPTPWIPRPPPITPWIPPITPWIPPTPPPPWIPPRILPPPPKNKEDNSDMNQPADVQYKMISRMLEGAVPYPRDTIPLLQANGLYKIYKLPKLPDIELKTTFEEASEYCISEGNRLATVENQQEFDLIANFLTDRPDNLIRMNFTLKTELEYSSALRTQHFWTSGNDLSRNGQYYWKSTGKRMITHPTWWNWQRPDHAVIDGVVEHCVGLIFEIKKNLLRMYDSRCDEKKVPLCEQIVTKEEILKEPDLYFFSYT